MSSSSNSVVSLKKTRYARAAFSTCPVYDMLRVKTSTITVSKNKKNKHDDHIRSVSLVSNKPLDIDKFQTWFGSLLESKGHDILRSKGIIEFSGLDDRYVFQGVHMLMDASPMGAWPDDCERISRIVFIGRNLESMGLKAGFESCQSN